MKELLAIECVKPDIRVIYDQIEPGSRVLDLGCGDGVLLQLLREKKNCEIQGIDRDQKEVSSCIERGVQVIQLNLNEGLSFFQDNSFDYVILGLTFQQIRKPHELLKDMCRVGKKSLVSVYNLGYFKTRLQILFGGRMPVNKRLPFEWYNTPNIHLGTGKDFQDMCRKEGFNIVSTEHISGSPSFIVKALPNLFSEICIYTISN